MLVFGLVAQRLTLVASGQQPGFRALPPMPPVEIARLYLESAIPMSKLDLAALGIVQ